MSIQPLLLSDLASRFDDNIDLFICGASFESRCLSISTHLPRDKVRKVVVIRNNTFQKEIERNYTEIKSIWNSKAADLVVSSDDPILSCDNMFAGLCRNDDRTGHHILVDISTFTHETLMMLYRVGSICFRSNDLVEFIYATADDYSLGEEKPEKWLSKGIKEFRSVIGYPGRLLPSKSNHLIVLFGFEEYRALAVIREFEPSLLSVGYGDRSEVSTGRHQETNEIKLRRLRSLVGNVNEFVFSCYDPLSLEATLAKLVTGNPDFNHIIAPMNTKLSALGAARFASKYDAVQLCYAQPEIYNVAGYSKPGTHFYCFAFDDFAKKQD